VVRYSRAVVGDGLVVGHSELTRSQALDHEVVPGAVEASPVATGTTNVLRRRSSSSRRGHGCPPTRIDGPGRVLRETDVGGAAARDLRLVGDLDRAPKVPWPRRTGGTPATAAYPWPDRALLVQLADAARATGEVGDPAAQASSLKPRLGQVALSLRAPAEPA